MRLVLPKPGTSRTALELKDKGLPEVALVGVHNQPFAREGLSPHRHDAMEIVYLLRGELIFHVAGRDYAMKGGDVFWTHADEEHSSSQKTYGKSLIYWTQVRLPEKPAAFLALDAEGAWPLVEGLRALPLRVFKGTRRMKPVFEEALVLAEGPASPLSRLGLAGRLVEFLRTVTECARNQAAPQISEDIAGALRLLEGRGDEPASIEDLARAAFLSESRFKAKFREQLGMPPWEYMLRRRVERARKLLQEERLSVTEVAHRLGFSSSQYFATVFRRFTLQRPSEVRSTKDKG
ncbi:MAG TPA: AraC family transcriptional regulator [Planctomycetota bacterium]|nr:AraC family transcriptional regulator [Planctomycetota bacterium]